MYLREGGGGGGTQKQTRANKRGGEGSQNMESISEHTFECLLGIINSI